MQSYIGRAQHLIAGELIKALSCVSANDSVHNQIVILARELGEPEPRLPEIPLEEAIATILFGYATKMMTTACTNALEMDLTKESETSVSGSQGSPAPAPTAVSQEIFVAAESLDAESSDSGSSDSDAESCHICGAIDEYYCSCDEGSDSGTSDAAESSDAESSDSEWAARLAANVESFDVNVESSDAIVDDATKAAVVSAAVAYVVAAAAARADAAITDDAAAAILSAAPKSTSLSVSSVFRNEVLCNSIDGDDMSTNDEQTMNEPKEPEYIVVQSGEFTAADFENQCDALTNAGRPKVCGFLSYFVFLKLFCVY